jgi:hypothetical protein
MPEGRPKGDKMRCECVRNLAHAPLDSIVLGMLSREWLGVKMGLEQGTDIYRGIQTLTVRALTASKISTSIAWSSSESTGSASITTTTSFGNAARTNGS